MNEIFVNDKLTLQRMIYDEILNLFYHSLKINNVNSMQYKYIMDSLIKTGSVAYDKPTDQWYRVTGTGRNEYGLPTKLVCISGDGLTKLHRNASYEPDELGCYRITFSHTDEDLHRYLWHTANILADLKLAILQNAKAIKAPMIIQAPSKELANSIRMACEEKEDGAPVVIVNKDVGQALIGQETKVEYTADKLMFLYDEIRAKCLTRLGFLTRVNNTDERIQSAQVYAVVGEAHDSIHSYIDWWNAQMEQFGLDFKMELNGCLDEVYTNSLMVTANDGDGKEGGYDKKGGSYEDSSASA